MIAEPAHDPERTEQLDLTRHDTTGVRRAGAGPRWSPEPTPDFHPHLRPVVSGHRPFDAAEGGRRTDRSERPAGQHAKDRSTKARRPERRRIAPDWMHRAYAHLRGWFWVDCPVCGQQFGGHEWRRMDRAADRGMGHIATLWTPPDEPLAEICPACTMRGEGCISHARHGNRHARCPYLFALPQ